MKIGLMFRVLGIALFIQLALGGLVTFGYLGTEVHIIWGVVLGILAIITLAFVVKLPSKPSRLVGITIGIGVDILIQAMLGFAAMEMGDVVSWIHFLNALAIYGMTLAATFMAMGAGRMASPPAPS